MSATGVFSTDFLYADVQVPVRACERNIAGLTGEYQAKSFCDVLHAETAQVEATFGAEFYAGMPALTVNRSGAGSAWYIGSRNDRRFHDDFYGRLIRDLRLPRALADSRLPQGVTTTARTDGARQLIFLISFQRDASEID